MKFEKLRNYNTVILSLIFTIGILFEIFVVLDAVDSKHSILPRRGREVEAPEPAPEFFPRHPTLLDHNSNLFMMPHASIPQKIEVDTDSITQFSLRADEEDAAALLGHLSYYKNLVDGLRIFNGKTAAFIDILPTGLLAHSVSLVYDEPGNWLCFLARPEKGLPQDDLYLYSIANGKLHRIRKPGYCPVELHHWKKQSCWIVSMGQDLNKDGFINNSSEPTEWMVYNSETEELKPIEED